jgi:hypothetical protein
MTTAGPECKRAAALIKLEMHRYSRGQCKGSSQDAYKKMMWILALSASALMAQDGPLANGIRHRGRQPEDKESCHPPVPRQGRFARHVNFAPLAVEGKPQINRDPRGSSLQIQLAPDAAKRLADLTRSQMNRPIAVVIGDRICPPQPFET